MPVEIRELIIKTEIQSQSSTRPDFVTQKDLAALCKQLLNEVKHNAKTQQLRDRFTR